MKNRSLIWALAALVLASCNTADVEKINFKDDHVLTASIENPTRTVVETGGTKVLWEVGENISVFLGGTNYKFTSKNTSPANTSDFEGSPSLSGVSSSNPIWAISPYKASSKISSGLITFEMKDAQRSFENSYDPNVHILAAYSTGTEVSFYNVTGGIRFTVKQSGITYATLKGNNSEILAGDVQIKASGVAPMIENVENPYTSITLQAPSGGFKTGVWYYITTIPVKFTKGFTIDFKQGDKAASFTTSQSAEVKRGLYGSISEIDRNLTFQDPTVHVESITVDPTSMKLAPSETGTITATVLPENATDKSIKWSSSNETVATVDQTGKVTAKAAGTTVIVALTNDGFKTATCNVTVAPLADDMRSQYAESSSGYQTFGKVIHFKYGTKYGSTANEFYVVPWGNGKAVEDTDAGHFSATSSKTANVSVSVVKVGNGCVFLVKALKDPTKGPEAWSDLTFEYTPNGGTKVSKAMRLIIAPSSASSAFSYKFRLWDQAAGTAVDASGGTLTHIMTKANDTQYSNLCVAFNMSQNDAICVPTTKDMASYTFTNSNSNAVNIAEENSNADYGTYPYTRITYKGVGKSNVTVKYVDYKGNTFNKTLAVTVKKNFIASDDYIKNVQNTLYEGPNSTSNRDYVGNTTYTEISLCKSNGTPYTNDELSDITWTASNSCVTLSNTNTNRIKVTGATVGDVTITAKGKDGSTKNYYMTCYKAIKSITKNSTTYILGLACTHNGVPGTDFTYSPTDATYTASTDFKWEATSNIVSVGATTGSITGNATGTTTIKVKPKPWYNTTYEARNVEVVDFRLKVTSSTNTSLLPLNKLFAWGETVKMAVGDEICVCFGRTNGASISAGGTCSFSKSESLNSSIASVSYNLEYATVKAKSAGTTYIDFDYRGTNGFIYKRYKIEVVPTFVWASGDIASNNYNARPKSSPYYMPIGGTPLDVYAYKGSGSSATQYSSSEAAALTWKSANENIATVSPASGNHTVVTAKSAGLVEIIATDSNGNTRSWWAQCYVPVTAITGTTKPFYIGCALAASFTYQMAYGSNRDYTLSPSNATFTSPDYIYWESSNTSLATVNRETGKVSVKGSGGEASFVIKGYPHPNVNGVATTNIRTFKYVLWQAYCYDQKNGGIPAGNSYGTPMPTANNVTVKKGSMSYLYFRTASNSSSGSINFTSATYSITTSDSSVIDLSAYNPGSNNYVWFSGKNTGTAEVVMSAKDNNHYFEIKFKVTVTN